MRNTLSVGMPGSASDSVSRTKLVSTEDVARDEARGLARQGSSPFVIASRLLALHRARFLPWFFFFLFLQGPLVVLASRRDLTELGTPGAYAAGPLSSFPAVMIGRFMTVLVLSLAVAACLAWFASKRRGHSGRARASTASRRMGRVSVDAPRSPRSGAALRTGSPKTSARRRRGASQANRPHQLSAVSALLFTALAFHLVCGVLPGLVGHDSVFQASSLYAIPAMLALYAGRRLPHRQVVDAVIWSLATLMIASLVVYPFLPQSTASTAGLDQRIPFVDSRFWGLGAGPNSIGPLAALQLLLQLHQRRHRTFLGTVAHIIAAAAALIVLVWSQSQTAWAAAIVVLPWLAIRSRLASRMSATSIRPQHVVFGIVVLLFAVGFIGSELIRIGAWDTLADQLPGRHARVWQSGAIDTATSVGDEMMTGRGRIWAVALDVWRDHPWLGFGGQAWQADFREFYGLPYGVHAHNQLLQAMSVSGLLGLAIFVVYLMTLGWFAWKTSAVSRGLTLALFGLIVVRMVTEVPLDNSALSSAETATHLLLLYLLLAYGSLRGKSPRPA